LRDATGESAQLYVQDGDRRVCIASLESPHGLRTIVPMGASFPLDVGGSAGKLLLAAADGRPLKPWVQSVGEREAGVASVSAPVCDDAGTIVAAVSVSGPIERTTRQPGKRYADDVEAAARRIERDAGLR
jgi:DNA-binding IclR family transcriptional regulator